MKKRAYILPEKLEEKVQRIQKELGLKDSGQVLSKAIELLDVSIGRKVVLEEKKKDRSLHITDLEEYNQTVILNDDGSPQKQ